MRAVDTNFLVRYAVGDEPRQVRVVERILDECAATGEQVYIPVPVLCELLWVLERTYRQTKAEIVFTLEGLLGVALFQFEQYPAVHRALAQYQRGRAGLTDYLIGELAAQAGCRDTVTFDRGLQGAPGFTLLKTT
jgi:predicted nucleic-acid-binding protein